MDTMTLVGYVIAAVSGGGLLKLFTIVWGRENRQIKSLRDIIDQMDIRIKAQDLRIATLEKALGVKDDEIISQEADINKFKRAMNSRMLCGADECPIVTRYNELTPTIK
jgi:hypothetical protein